ncbi:uncharacterized protein LOC120350376 [Nilaparvata lugens]|uniref:uncharacterized protein LOC120350376 n=1 Tax=Nilaparvata lugens TaxID=108931 RepID=UPI00193EAE08|nr:uncharacterized protein LOC120350376 [Nilaparvata lugens]
MRGKLSFTSETSETSRIKMSSPSSASYILPDSPPPQRVLNHWQRKAAESCAASSAAAAASAAASAASPASSSASPLKRRGIFVQRERGEEIVIPDSPLPQSTAPTWAPRRAVLTTLSNKIKQRQAKRKLAFEEAEVSGEEEDEVLTQSKKRVVDEDSSITPLLREEEEAENEMEVETEELLAIINRTEKPWTPLRQLVENTPYPIVAVRQITNQHGRRVILKVHLTASRLTDIYMPERYSSILSSKDIEQFNKNCKSLCLFVKHVNAFLTDINIVKCKISKFGI